MIDGRRKENVGSYVKIGCVISFSDDNGAQVQFGLLHNPPKGRGGSLFFLFRERMTNKKVLKSKPFSPLERS